MTHCLSGAATRCSLAEVEDLNSLLGFAVTADDVMECRWARLSVGGMVWVGCA